MAKRKRTKKIFYDYNVYRDRPFGLKWGTAYAMDELVKGIEENKLEALKNNVEMPQMTRTEVDTILSESFLYYKNVSLQLNLKDEFGRYLDNIEGQFTGEAYEDYFVIEDTRIFWEDVRHIEILKDEKWFKVDVFHSKIKLDKTKKNEDEYIELIKDEFYQDFYDGEDFSDGLD